MEIIESLAIQTPMMIASVVLVFAALLKVGKEKGAILVLLGAIGLCLMALLTPILYYFMPRMMESMGVDDFGSVYQVVGLISNLFWAGTIALIAIVTFVRSPAANQSSPLSAPTE